jgi:RNA-binding protein
MFTSKQRASLRAKASTIDTIMQVGKNGVNDNLIASLSDALNARELIKISVLDNSPDDVREVGITLANALNAEFVCAIGKKVVLYRYSNKKGIVHIEY